MYGAANSEILERAMDRISKRQAIEIKKPLPSQ